MQNRLQHILILMFATIHSRQAIKTLFTGKYYRIRDCCLEAYPLRSVWIPSDTLLAPGPCKGPFKGTALEPLMLQDVHCWDSSRNLTSVARWGLWCSSSCQTDDTKVTMGAKQDVRTPGWHSLKMSGNCCEYEYCIFENRSKGYQGGLDILESHNQR